ncbi:hypothetical protein PILCRDRAFT_822403 [Piloderma croceum F 1598]|uniref:Uncharacterized protein n=1 Tax=Piloderma croceum (strain F 1598) TaxID=765440 RepID=A0A0C3F7S3_PILCF|nr:hypothetical protein PILCRDRAFT_822403 [Piloderma croceum F 1598]
MDNDNTRGVDPHNTLTLMSFFQTSALSSLDTLIEQANEWVLFLSSLETSAQSRET